MKILLFLLGTAMATEPDYVTIQKGEVATISGRIFTDEALSSMIAQHERELEQSKIDSQYTFNQFKAEQDLKYTLLETRTQAEINMYLAMVEARDQQIKRDKKADIWQRWATYGAFVLGVGSTIGITYAVNQGIR